MAKKIKFPARFSDTFIDKKVKKGDIEEEYTAVIAPSGQFWNNLTPSQQAEWKEKVTEIGEDPEDYLHNMRQMFPQNPKGAK